MPHFIIDCSQTVLDIHPGQTIMKEVYDCAVGTDLFGKGDVKVRIRPFEEYILGEGKSDFIHVFGNIMEGRTIEQKADLSARIVRRLKTMFPDVPIVSMNVRDFERATYNNRDMVG